MKNSLKVIVACAFIFAFIGLLGLVFGIARGTSSSRDFEVAKREFARIRPFPGAERVSGGSIKKVLAVSVYEYCVCSGTASEVMKHFREEAARNGWVPASVDVKGLGDVPGIDHKTQFGKSSLFMTIVAFEGGVESPGRTPGIRYCIAITNRWA